MQKTEQKILGIALNAENRVFDKDPGRGKFLEIDPSLQHSFKTAPYMHNVGYKTLKEVMNFYNKGSGKAFGFKAENQILSDTPLRLTDKKIDNSIEFMKAPDDE